MRKMAIVALMALLQIELSAQEWGRPLDVPVSFSGTYGELRHNHFHAGVDWRVGGKVGDPIHAIKEGFISRVSVSVYGYGNAVYIDHPDGTMSVYGHMLEFTDAVARKVKKEQYEKESFAVNLTFGPDEFPVRKGDVIGKVGNTGSSAGPHLHMEIRDKEQNLSLNYLARGIYDISDKVKPVFQKVIFYAYEDSTGIPLSAKVKTVTFPRKEQSVIHLPHKSFLAIDAVDKMEGTPGKLAVEIYSVLLDGELLYRFKVGEVGYDLDKYIQSVIMYSESYRGGSDMVKTLVDPGNGLSDRIEAAGNGVIELEDYNNHKVVVEIEDAFGNRSSASFTICRDDSVTGAGLPDPEIHTPMAWYLPNIWSNDTVTFSIPAGNLYNSIYFKAQKVAERDTLANVWSDVMQFGDPSIPLHRGAVVSFSNPSIPEELREKAIVAAYRPDGSLSGVGGEWQENFLTADVGFGAYCVALDTIAPTASFNFAKGGKLYGGKFYINIKDNLSGVADFRVEIDGRWPLASRRGGRITVYASSLGLKAGKHTVVVRLVDGCGNESENKISFIV